MTRDVSQPEMSALKLRKLKKSTLMSVTPETHQPAMAPYFAVAAAAFEWYSLAAAFRLALLVIACGEGGAVSWSSGCTFWASAPIISSAIL